MKIPGQKRKGDLKGKERKRRKMQQDSTGKPRGEDRKKFERGYREKKKGKTEDLGGSVHKGTEKSQKKKIGLGERPIYTEGC